MLKKLFTTALAATMLLSTTTVFASKTITFKDWAEYYATPYYQKELKEHDTAAAEMFARVEATDWSKLPPVPNANYTKPANKYTSYIFCPTVGYLWCGMSKTRVETILSPLTTKETDRHETIFGNGWAGTGIGTILSPYVAVAVDKGDRETVTPWLDSWITQADGKGTTSHDVRYYLNQDAFIGITYVYGIDGEQYVLDIGVTNIPDATVTATDVETEQTITARAGDVQRVNVHSTMDYAGACAGCGKYYGATSLGEPSYCGTSIQGRGATNPVGNIHYDHSNTMYPYMVKAETFNR